MSSLDTSTLRHWHLFSEGLNISAYNSNRKPFISPLAQLIRDAWNLSYHQHFGSSDDRDFTWNPSYTQLRFDEAIDIIYKHQHPQQCSDKKYMISEGWPVGFGSEWHVEGATLGLAMETNRIFLSRTSDGRSWPKPESICGKDSTVIKCYYEPWSNCSFEKGTKISDTMTLYHEIKKYRQYQSPKIINLSVIECLSHEDECLIPTKDLIPYQLQPIVNSLPIPPQFRYYWWRAVSIAYLFRINAGSRDYINRIRIPNINRLHGRCVSMYVRQGDKASEMRLHPFQEYADAAVLVWNRTFGHVSSSSSSSHLHQHQHQHQHHLMKSGPITSDSRPTIVLGSETESVFKQAIEWTDKNNWNLIYNPLQRAILNSTSPFTYLTMLSTLVDLMSCDAMVCTLPSNYCRVLDELRVMAIGKPHIPFVDLSSETCRKPPCGIERSNVKDFHSFGW